MSEKKQPTPAEEMFPYIWCLVQSVILMKALVYYFGLQASNDPSPENDILLGVALTFSLSSLIWFAWRQTRKAKLSQNQN